MAQTEISGYFPAKKRRTGDHASVKRRKLTESSRLDIPVLQDSSDPTSVPLSEPVKTKTPVARTKKSTVKRSRQTKRATTRLKGQKILSELFDSRPAQGSNEQDKTESSTSKTGPSLPEAEQSPSHESTPPQSNKKSLQSVKDGPQYLSESVLLSPCADTMSKLAAVKPRPQAQVPLPLSRGAALLQLAKQRSPVKTRSQARELHCEAVRRGTVVKEMAKLSARELSLPTTNERRGQRSSAKALAEATPHEWPTMKEFRSLEIESPKKDKSRVPAYKRYQSLAEATPPSSSEGVELPLPQSYKLLSEKFRCTDTVVNMLQKRRETVTFSKVKRAVQEMCRRDFECRNLAQMKTVYPTAYTFRQEANIPGSFDNKHQLTVECNTEHSAGSLNPTDLINRRKTFHQGLVSLVRDHHRQFLAKLEPPLTIPDDKVLRWHPEFSLEALPEVPESELPRPPMKDCYSGAADLLKAAHSRLAPKVQTALANAVCSDSNEGASQSDPSLKGVPHSIDPSLKGVSQALLDKIRAKEAAKNQAKITRDPIKEQQLEMVARLPEVVRILRGFFVGEKKAALLWDEVVSKLTDSTMSRLSPERTGEHVVFLSELAPSWLSLVTIKKKRYVKLDRRQDIKTVLEAIQQAENRLK